MKPYLLVIIFLLLPSVHAATLQEQKVDITITNDGSAFWEVLLQYDENTDRSDFFVLSNIRNTEVFVDGELQECDVSREGLGTSIVCSNLNTSEIMYLFKTPDLIRGLQNYQKFEYRFPVSQPMKELSVILRLPLGTGVVEKNELRGTGLNPFEPPSGIEGSDGRIITLSWNFKDPKLGESIDVSAIYEQISFEPQAEVFLIIVIIAVVIIIGSLLMLSRRHRVRDVLPVLTDGERKVMEILLREKKDVDQRKIVGELDYSKSKISRIIRDLEGRGLIEKKQKGRTNMIRLKHDVKRKEEKDEKKEKQQKTIDKLLGKE